MLNAWRKKSSSQRRTALVTTPDGCALATTTRGVDGRYELLSCLSIEAPAAKQQAIIASWFAERQDFGLVGSVLDAADYQLLLVESPDVLPAELKAAVRWRLKDLIDFPVEDAVVDVFGIPEQARRTGAKMMYAVAAKRQAIDTQVAFLKSVVPGFEIIDIPELALRNLAARLPEAAEGLILLWLNSDSAQLLVIKDATLYVTRRVQFADRRHDAGSLDADDVDAIALELQRSMDYFESHYEQAPIGHLVIAPHGDASRNLATALGAQTAMRIQTFEVARVLKVPPGLDLSARASLLAIGAAMRDDKPAL